MAPFSVGTGLCLTAHADTSVGLASCDSGNPDQPWSRFVKYEVFEIQQQPRALTAHADSSDVTVGPWEKGSAYQQWTEW